MDKSRVPVPVAMLLATMLIVSHALPEYAAATDAVAKSVANTEPAAAAANPLIPNQPQIVENTRVQLKDWLTYEKTTLLADNSSLYQYVSEVSSVLAGAATFNYAEFGSDDSSGTDTVLPGPMLRLSFVPRFNCTPLISVVFKAEDLDAPKRQRLQSALEGMRFVVDGTRIAFPALTENTEHSVQAHYDAELRRRNNFRILVEAGSSANIELVKPDKESVIFDYSLSGSKRAINRSRSACMVHSN